MIGRRGWKREAPALCMAALGSPGPTTPQPLDFEMLTASHSIPPPWSLREMGRGPNMRPKCEWASLQDAIVSNGHPPTEASSDSFFPLLQTHAVADYDDDIPI